MYNTIVVGTDGSSTAAIAVERASEIARLTGARLHVVSSYHPVRPQLAGRAPAGEFNIPPDFQADAVLGDAASRLRAEGLEVEEHAPKGDPGRCPHRHRAHRGGGPDRARQPGHAGSAAGTGQRGQQGVPQRSLRSTDRADDPGLTAAPRRRCMSTRSPRKGTPSRSSSRR